MIKNLDNVINFVGDVKAKEEVIKEINNEIKILDEKKTTKKDVLIALGELTIRETKYIDTKHKYNAEKDSMLINTDWNKLNEERIEEGLDKLSSDKKKQAYIDSELANLKRDVNLAELEYNATKRRYEQLLIFYKVENMEN